MPQCVHQRQFAWRPVLTTSGKWVWWRHYVKLVKIYWGPTSEPPVVDAEYYTEGEWLLEQLKKDHNSAPTSDYKVNFKACATGFEVG